MDPIEKNKFKSLEYRSTERRNIFLAEYNTVYFYIPKVASTSLKKLCALLLGINQKSKFHEIDFPSISRKLLVNNGQYFKFAFVRNPYDRLVSGYFGRVIKSTKLYKKKRWKDKSFSDFIKILYDTSDENMNIHFRPQHTFLTDDKGELIVDYVGRFENINEDFREIAKNAGLPDDVILPHRTSSEHDIYRKYYTEETKQLVSERFAKDLEIFKYSY